MVEYREVVDAPGYRVGSDGSVWTCRVKKRLPGRQGFCYVLGEEWRPMKPYRPRVGYRTIRLRRDGKIKEDRIYILMLEAFRGPRPDGCVGRHLDDNPENDSLDNLMWGTNSENAIDRVRNGVSGWPRRCFSPEEIRDIRQRVAGGETMTSTARLYGVGVTAISDIVRRRTYAYY